MRLVIFNSVININNKEKYNNNFFYRNIYIKKLIGNGEQDGLFYTSHDSLNIEFNAYNVTLNDLYQSNKHETSILYLEKNNFANIDK